MVYPEKIRFVMTSQSYPESYDVFYAQRQQPVARVYVTGKSCIAYSNLSEEDIYRNFISGYWGFANSTERGVHMGAIREALVEDIREHLNLPKC